LEEIILHQFAEKLEMAGFARHSVECLVYDLSRFFRFLEQHENIRSLDKVKPAHFTAYHSSLCYERNEKNVFLKPSTVFKRMSAIKVFYRIMHEQRLIRQDYAGVIMLPKVKQALPRNIPTVEDMNKLLDAIPANTPLSLRDRAMLELLYAAGLRNEEIRTIKISDVDLSERTVFVTGKGSKDRIVPIGSWVMRWLVEYLETARPTLANKTKDCGLLFVSKNGNKLTSPSLNEIVCTHAAKAGLASHVSPHTLRHACATHLLKAGADIRVIQELLGHGSIASTQVYTHIDISFLKKAHAQYHPREMAAYGESE
jgi:integrase/recombinase XerD